MLIDCLPSAYDFEQGNEWLLWNEIIKMEIKLEISKIGNIIKLN